MYYRKLPTRKSLQLIDWAEVNNVNYDIWNAEESFMGSETTEIGLERWPDEEEEEETKPQTTRHTN